MYNSRESNLRIPDGYSKKNGNTKGKGIGLLILEFCGHG